MLNCELCGDKDPNPLIILSKKQPNGALQTLACEECAEKSDIYCKVHKRPHLGFVDDTTACIVCVEETVREHFAGAEETMRKILALLDNEEEKEELFGLIEPLSILTRTTQAGCVLRFVVTRALRLRLTIDAVIEEVMRTRSIRTLLPAVDLFG